MFVVGTETLESPVYHESIKTQIWIVGRSNFEPDQFIRSKVVSKIRVEIESEVR
jgi:hypothetical protein